MFGHADGGKSLEGFGSRGRPRAADQNRPTVSASSHVLAVQLGRSNLGMVHAALCFKLPQVPPVESSTRLAYRWKLECSLAWLLANRRLMVRYERRADLLTAFLNLAWPICARKLTPL
jgi:hypothetical protein